MKYTLCVTALTSDMGVLATGPVACFSTNCDGGDGNIAEDAVSTCMICYERPKNSALNCGCVHSVSFLESPNLSFDTFFASCRHQFCSVCTKASTTCPVCRVAITSRLRLFPT